MDVRKEVTRLWQSWRKRERRILKSYARGAPDMKFRLRCLIVVNFVQGTSPTIISQVLGCSRSTAYRVAKQFVSEGIAGLIDRREDNGADKVNESYVSLLLVVVSGSPREHRYARPTWTQELLVLVLAEKTGITISTTTMCRLLKRLRVRSGKPKPVVGCPWSKHRKTRCLNNILRLIANLPKGHVVVYADEVDIHLNPKIGSDWMLRGTQKQVLTPGQNKKRYLAGALNAKTSRLTWVESDHKTSDVFIDQLWTLVKDDYPNARCIHIILDNYRIHKSKQTEIALKALAGKVQLHFLPPYCPDHNKIERLWKDLHDNVTRNHRCRNMNELMSNVRDYLHIRKADKKHKYVTHSAA